MSKKIMKPFEKDRIPMAAKMTPELAEQLYTQSLINMANGDLPANLGNAVINGLVTISKERRASRRQAIEDKDAQAILIGTNKE